MRPYKRIFKEARIETEKVEWYDWAASYFINNDHSGLSDEDLELADQFLDEMKADGYSWCIDADFDSKRFGKPMGYRLAGDLIEYTFQKTMKESRFRKRNSLKEAKSLPMNLVKQYEMRAEAERDAGTEIDINENIPYIAVDFANGQNYYIQGEEAEELLNEVPDNLDPEDYILAISQNW